MPKGRSRDGAGGRGSRSRKNGAEGNGHPALGTPDTNGHGDKKPTSWMGGGLWGSVSSNGNGVHSSIGPGAGSSNGHGIIASDGHDLVSSNGHGKLARAELGAVDYTLAKRALLRDAQRGLLSRLDLCDAHPELLRAAKYCGEEAQRPCPVCGELNLRLIAYVYADELKRDNGRVWAIETALALAARCKDGTCYVVEVCTSCSWNHLNEAFVARSAG